MEKDECCLSVLGLPRLQYDDAVVDLSPKHTALLGKLATLDGAQASRSDLARLLWPSASERSARHSLSQAIYDLRSRTTRALILAESEFLGLGEVVDSDVSNFVEAIEQRHWEAAAAAYTGSLLQALHLEGCVEFSHWLDGARSRYRGLAERVLDELFAAADWGRISTLATAMLSDDPENVKTLSLHIGALAEMNGVAAASAEFNTIPDSIRTEIGSFDDLLARLGGRSSASVESGVGTFVGRTRELEVLSECTVNSRAQGPALTLLQGEPGIGKSSLLARFAKLRTLRSDLCLYAKANEIERYVPFGVVDQWIRAIPHRLLDSFSNVPWWGALQSAFPTSVTRPESLPRDPIDQRRLFETLRRLFLSLSRQRPLIMCIDDSHHSDSASLAFLSYLLDKEDTAPILVILTGHIHNSSKLWGLTEQPGTSVLDVGPLTADDVDQWLLRSGIVNPAARAETVPRLLAKTGGNPLLISALLEGGRDLRAEDMPSTVTAYFQPTIRSLSASARSLLATLSIAGEAVSYEILTEVLGMTAYATQRAANELLISKLAVESGKDLALRHGLIADVALSVTSDAETRRLHGRTARVFARRQPPGAAMAAVSHDIAGNRRAAHLAAMQAAHACAILNAHEEGLFFLKLAMSNAPTPEDAAVAKLSICDVLLRVKRPREVLDLLKEPDSGVGQADRDRLHVQWLRARVVLATDDHELRVQWTEAQTLGSDYDPDRLVDLYTEMGSVAHDFGSDELALEILLRLGSLLDRLPDSATKARRSIRPILIRGVIGNCADALAELAELQSPEVGDADYQCIYFAARASLRVSSGNMLSAERDFHRALFIAERDALYHTLFMIHNNLGVCLIEQGRYGEAEEQLGYAEDYGSPEIHPTKFRLVADNLSILYYEGGRYKEALDLVDRDFSHRSGRGIRGQISRFSILGLSYLSLGRIGNAREVHRELQLRQPNSAPIRTDLSYMHIFHARILVADEQPYAAIEYLDNVAATYSLSLALTRMRLQLEASRIRLQLGVAIPDIVGLRAELESTGATPLIQQADELYRRAQTHLH